MKNLYSIVGACLLLCCLAVPCTAQSGDTRDATGKTAPASAMGGMGSGGVIGKPPVGAMGSMGSGGVIGKPPVGATGSFGSGGVTGKTAPRGITRRVYTQGAPGSSNDSEPEEDDTE
jgi:hypothetical protein